jgi:predicted 2-oxoglutarate/Fe(II)-dependent dioxygenase YbiX
MAESRQATTTIPIVMGAAGDPVGSGLAAKTHLGRGQEGLQVAKVREHAGLRERSAVLTLINETLYRTVTPVKQFLGLLV